ncbi:MAG: sugar phosphate nucleotidyltransferase, partial [Candidatus Methanomethylophilaceae archaeon]|nr:sugar phosphate nucleotidyltransferase [Candidatus Methanomethylophilaceae archaeon]
HTLEALKAVGVTKVSIVVGFQSERIRKFYQKGSSLGLEIDYIEQKERKGTAHAIGMADGRFQEPFFCMAGDVMVSSLDLASMIDIHKSKDASVMSAVAVKNPSAYGVLWVQDGMMREIVEKPQKPVGNLINASIYLLDPSIFEYIRSTAISSRGEYEITDTLSLMAAKEGVAVHELQGEWLDIGSPWDLLEANRKIMEHMERRIDGKVEPGCHIHGAVVVEEGARIRSGSYIEGPVYISTGCDIGPNCYIRAHTCLGQDCRVGNPCEVKNTLVFAGSKIPHQTYVGDSIIGQNCNLGAGTKVANLRFDHSSIRVKVKDREVDTGLRKLGVIMGDNVNTGINSIILPGTIIHQGASIGPGGKAQGVIGPGSFIR